MKAKINQEIETKDGIRGIVDVVYENSVVIKITDNPTEISYPNSKTVVNHKNYKILKRK